MGEVGFLTSDSPISPRPIAPDPTFHAGFTKTSWKVKSALGSYLWFGIVKRPPRYLLSS